MPSVILLERPVQPDHTVRAVCQDCGDHGYTTQGVLDMPSVAKRCPDCYYVWLIRSDVDTGDDTRKWKWTFPDGT